MRGLSLIELMVAMVIGLLVVVAVIGAYIGSSQAAKVTDAQARMNEDAQSALAILSLQIRMAGNNPEQPWRLNTSARNPVYLPTTLTTTLVPAGFSIRGCDGKFTNMALAADLDGLACTGGATAAPDSIAVNYEADTYNTIAKPGSSAPTDCLGYPIAPATATLATIDPITGVHVLANVPYYVADNRFYVETSAGTGTPSLFCKGNGAGSVAAPLIENVENIQITYGTAPAGATSTAGNVAGYLSADGVATDPGLAALPNDAARWKKVVTVRLCIVVRSSQAMAGDLASARYYRCDGSLETNPPDLRFRRAYAATVVVRNRT